jgi:hypothetical protein
MRTLSLRAIALVIAATLGLGMSAAEAQWTAQAEALFLRPGTSVGNGDDNVFGFEEASRIGVGYQNSCGVGARVNWFQFDHEADDSDVGELAFDTHQVDFELYKQLNLASNLLLEFSGGLRYNNTEHDYDGEPNDFEGVGGLFGVKAGLKTGANGLLYSRAKFAVLMGDGAHDGRDEDLDPAFDSIRQQTEIGVGYEHNICMGGTILTPRVGFEWWNWDGFGIDPVDEHPDTALGFVGFVVGLGAAF